MCIASVIERLACLDLATAAPVIKGSSALANGLALSDSEKFAVEEIRREAGAVCGRLNVAEAIRTGSDATMPLASANTRALWTRSGTNCSLSFL